MKGNTNPVIGQQVERLFKNSLANHPEVITRLKEYFHIHGEFAKAYSTGTDAGKSDVVLRFSDGRNLSANIKAFKVGFNQITRLKIAAFCKQFDLNTLNEIFEQGAIRVAGKNGRFVLEEQEQGVFQHLNPIAASILQFAIARLENPELLVLFDRVANRMLIYDLASILQSLDYQVTFSKRGVIKIGRYFTIQRKGGNGVHSLHIEKTSLDHPGNNLQIKMNIKRFVLENTPITTYTP